MREMSEHLKIAWARSLWLAIWITFLIGSASDSVGRVPDNPSEPIEWWLPIILVGMFGLIIWLAGSAAYHFACWQEEGR